MKYILGMPDAVSSIVANNRGESDANLSCKIKHIKILDEDYYTTPDSEDDIVEGITYYSSEDLIDMLLHDFPFKIEIYIDGTLYDATTPIVIAANSPTTTIEYKVRWPYETGTGNTLAANDAIDTYWGEKAYDYYHDPLTQGDVYCIEVELLVTATQTHTS